MLPVRREAGVLDPAVWDWNGTSSVVNGHLLVESGSVYTTGLVINGPDEIAEMTVVSYTAMGNPDAAITVGATNQIGVPGVPWASLLPRLDPVLLVSFDGTSVAFNDTPLLTAVAAGSTYGIVMHAGDIVFDLNRGMSTYAVPGAWANSMFLWIGDYEGAFAAPEVDDLEIDHVLVRRYVEILPTVLAGAEEDV